MNLGWEYGESEEGDAVFAEEDGSPRAAVGSKWQGVVGNERVVGSSSTPSSDALRLPLSTFDRTVDEITSRSVQFPSSGWLPTSSSSESQFDSAKLTGLRDLGG